MKLVFDTDILSTFGKIRRLDLLMELFPNARFIVPPSVYDELFKARERGYEFVDYIDQNRIKFIDLSMILKSLLVAEVLTGDVLKALIDEIERKDRMVVKDKGVILTENGDK